MDQFVSKANIQVLDRASAILRVLTQHHDPVNLKVISDETCLHISTCHRILSDLVRLRCGKRRFCRHIPLRPAISSARKLGKRKNLGSRYGKNRNAASS